MTMTFALVGGGWRASAYWRLAAELDGIACVGAVVRTPRAMPVPAYGSLDECLAAKRPDFVVTAVPRTANAQVVIEAVERGLPVLSETPPAQDVGPLRPYAEHIQVAEQYLLMPTHASRLAAVRGGVIGTPSQVQVSSTQFHHAVALMRGYLQAPPGPVTVRATRHVAPLVQPLKRGGWTDDPDAKPATTTLAVLDFGHGRSGLYDFTDNQTRNQLRFRRILVRGSHGELRDDEVVRLTGPRTIVTTPLVRTTAGDVALGDNVHYHNAYRGMRLNDDEIATATMLDAMAAWVRGDGPPPYPFAEGAHDHAVGLAIEEAAATGRTVTTAS
jgi:predicted dehydrogenase